MLPALRDLAFSVLRINFPEEEALGEKLDVDRPVSQHPEML